MTKEETVQFIQGGEWISIAVELRPSINKSPSGDMLPFYVSRKFIFSPGDKFECTVINYADSNGKIPLVKIVIKGHNRWLEAHPIAEGAFKADYIADEAYEVTPLHPGFADAANKFITAGLAKWQVNVMQDIKARAFALFDLHEGQIYIDYDLIYIFNGLLFMGSKNVDGRAFDRPENRPTNLQIPLVRKKV